jgi:hypothetical protein
MVQLHERQEERLCLGITEIMPVLNENKPITPLTPETYAALRQKGIGVLIWMAFAAAGMAALYFLSFFAGD